MMNPSVVSDICSRSVKVHLADGVVERFGYGANGNTLVVGPPGTGKTESMLKPDILDNPGASFVIDDKKGALSYQLGPYLEANGYEVRIFDLIHFEGNLTYNPFETLRSREDIMALAQMLFPKDRKTNDEFWVHTARQLLVALIEIGCHEYGEQMSFRRLCAMLDSVDIDNECDYGPGTVEALRREIEQEQREEERRAEVLRRLHGPETEAPGDGAPGTRQDGGAHGLIRSAVSETRQGGTHVFIRPVDRIRPAAAERKAPYSDPVLALIWKHLTQGKSYRGMQDYMTSRKAASDTFRSIVIELQSELTKYASEELMRVMERNSLCFEEIGKRKIAVFVANSDTDSKFAMVIQLFYRDVTKALIECADTEYRHSGGQLPRHVRFILDDFCSGIKVPDFGVTIANCRSRNISFLIAIQDLDQLNAVYENQAGTIRACMRYQAFYPTKNITTAHYIAEISGTDMREAYGLREGTVYVWTVGLARRTGRFRTHDMPQYRESRRLLEEKAQVR